MSQDSDLDLVFVIDRSGSMSGSETDTMGGFNSFIEREAKKEFNTKVTTVLFDHKYELLYTRKDIKDVEKLTDKEYYVRGSTALLDAIGRTITTLDKEIDNKVLFVVMTDGYENSSVEFTKTQIKNLMENHDWEFIYLGADIGSFADADAIHFKKSRVARYRKDRQGVEDAFLSVSEASYDLRVCENLDNSDWNERLEKHD